MKRKIYLAASVALLATAIGAAYAARSGENDALAISSAKISMTQAIAAAEQHVGGRASRAEYERHKGKWTFDVEVVKDNTVMNVRVDPASARILAAVEDKADHDDADD